MRRQKHNHHTTGGSMIQLVLLFQVLLFFTELLLIHSVSATSATSSGSSSSTKNVKKKNLKKKVVIGVDGGTESIRACCFDASNGQVIGSAYAASPYKTYHPNPGWAEQLPEDWWKQMKTSIRKAVDALHDHAHAEEEYEICGICLDTTCCSVVILDSNYKPLRPALLWMDARSAKQTTEILNKCKGNPALTVNCNGEGPISAEWMTPKALWIHQNEPTKWKKAKTICEYQDYMNYKLTGKMVASSCNAATRWHWNGEECILTDSKENKYPGRPLSLYETLGIPELAEKLPAKCLPMGATIGTLTKEAANELNLPQDLPVIQGGPDAFVGMIGLGVVNPGQLCLITGSSHLHCIVTDKPTTAPGTWGAYKGAPLPGLNFAEGGQSSTGSIVRWAKSKLFEEEELSYQTLDQEASEIQPGAEGLIALETFQGARTPVTDPLARGAFVGLTLSHSRAHVWRALLEAVCYGTRACVEGLANAGHKADEIIIAGGATRSKLWLQMHADITGLPVVVCENGDAPLLGCAILASVGVGIHKDVNSAVQAMVRQQNRVMPSNKDVVDKYTELYENVYTKLVESARPVAHAIANLRGGGGAGGTASSSGGGEETTTTTTTTTTTSSSKHNNRQTVLQQQQQQQKPAAIISPSLLAADWADMKGAVGTCIRAKATQLHVDVFDGVFIDSPYALTFGPQMVQAIRKSCDDALLLDKQQQRAAIVLDLHMCVDRPLRYVEAMAEAGGDRFIFQWEAMGGGDGSKEQQIKKATELAQAVRKTGMQCGVSINPETSVDLIYPLLKTGLVDLVDILAVEPGFGGQKFQPKSLQKVAMLRQWRDENEFEFDILVDGGINQKTAPAVLESGADILVAGTFLFQHPTSLDVGVNELLANTSH